MTTMLLRGALVAVVFVLGAAAAGDRAAAQAACNPAVQLCS